MTIIAAPVVIAMEAGALVCGVFSVASKYINKKLQAKAIKHNKIRMLAEAKTNTIVDHVSKALMDGVISDDEFSLLISEVNKYKEMKEDIRSSTHKTLKIDEEAEKKLIERGKEEARKSFLAKLNLK